MIMSRLNIIEWAVDRLSEWAIDKGAVTVNLHPVEQALETLQALGPALGVSIHPLDLNAIKPDEGVRLKCQIPLCEYYGVSKVCPPYLPSVQQFREALTFFRGALLVVYTVPYAGLPKPGEQGFTAENHLRQAIHTLESKAQSMGYYRAIGLTVGGCKLCTQCTPHGEPCRHPFLARPSPEGLGIDLLQLAKTAGCAVQWPPGDNVNFLGLVLI